MSSVVEKFVYYPNPTAALIPKAESQNCDSVSPCASLLQPQPLGIIVESNIGNYYIIIAWILMQN